MYIIVAYIYLHNQTNLIFEGKIPEANQDVPKTSQISM